MTRDEFESRYRLLQQVTRAGEAETHHALGPAGAVVMVHFLTGELATRIRSLMAEPESARPDRILETVDVEGSPVLITKFIMDFEDLATWLEAEDVSVAPPPPAPQPSDEGESEGEPGEFTKLFAAPDLPEPADPSPPPDGSPAEARSATDVDRPGEFTRLFRARTPEGEPEAGAEPDVEAEPEPESSPGPGASGTPSTSETVDPGRDASRDPSPGGEKDGEDREPGELTRLFQGMERPEPEPRSSGKDVGTPPAEGGAGTGREGEPPSGPSEFTRLFQSPPEVGRPPETPRTAPSSSSSQPSPPPPPPTPPPPPPPPTPTRKPPPRRPSAGPPRTGSPDEAPPTERSGSGAGSSDVPEPRYGADSESEAGPAGPRDRREPGELTSRFAAHPPTSPPDRGSPEHDRWSFGDDDPPAGAEDTVADDYLDRLYDASRPGGTSAERGSAGVGPSPGPPPPPPGESGGGGAGERGPSPYTRVISGMEMPKAGGPAPPPPAAARSAGPGSDAGGGGEGDRPSLWPFLLGIALVVVLAAALVLGYVLITSRDTAPEGTDPGATPEAGDSVALVTGSEHPFGSRPRLTPGSSPSAGA